MLFEAASPQPASPSSDHLHFAGLNPIDVVAPRNLDVPVRGYSDDLTGESDIPGHTPGNLGADCNERLSHVDHSTCGGVEMSTAIARIILEHSYRSEWSGPAKWVWECRHEGCAASGASDEEHAAHLAERITAAIRNNLT
ncbi:hypothetical protein M2272_005879 [Mycobacterium frederiksbergense]|uniref:Uncharacterized protein n=1 Tax=Mycolicibacterium frederiksbergense TaxID=117567 RepID=A0ABT6L8D0_9MYCO|nr:hypothetical protein [Mycolicibacterium frederiksbergense]MDH6199211.1 hypothetical protein [Mycolicibacterium frederiksbergense]